MNIPRGTFRLSILIAVLVAAYYGISDYMTAVNSNAEDMRIWTTLRCGERFLGQDMSSYTSPVRSDVIDIGKAGCSSSTFWATRDEIREAVAQTDPPVSRYSRVGEPLVYPRLDGLKIPSSAFDPRSHLASLQIDSM